MKYTFLKDKLLAPEENSRTLEMELNYSWWNFFNVGISVEDTEERTEFNKADNLNGIVMEKTIQDFEKNGDQDKIKKIQKIKLCKQTRLP